MLRPEAGRLLLAHPNISLRMNESQSVEVFFDWCRRNNRTVGIERKILELGIVDNLNKSFAEMGPSDFPQIDPAAADAIMDFAAEGFISLYAERKSSSVFYMYAVPARKNMKELAMSMNLEFAGLTTQTAAEFGARLLERTKEFEITILTLQILADTSAFVPPDWFLCAPEDIAH